MKNKIVFSAFMVFIVLSACKTTEMLPKDFTGKIIMFSKGGGVTGKTIYYYLFDNNMLYKKENIENSIIISQEISTQIFEQAINIIDDKYENGYAKKNPRLLASVIDLQSKIYINSLNNN